MKWDPAKYVQFSDHRSRPFFDLTARVSAEDPKLVIDLGCGPGNLTAALAERWPEAQVVGLDSSPEMVERAAAAQSLPNLRFEAGDISVWTPPAGLDVLVSNAVLQWVPGHRALMAQWLAAMAPGSWLAVQVPGNFGAPSHRLMLELAESDEWSGRLSGVLAHDDAVGEPAEYLALLLDGGCEADAWETTYQQLLTGEDPVLEWVRGAGLRPVLNALEPGDAQVFQQEYAALLREAYPATPHGTVYPFRRTFSVGRKR
jgi:trans-aconitate 2-methyltransferase